MNVTIVMGTRPGIIKMAPIYVALAKIESISTSIIYTGQHYSSILKDDIISAFSLPRPDFSIDGIDKCKTHAQQISKMMIGCAQFFSSKKPDIVLVCGDANTNLAAGLAARKTNCFLCHVESGLRSHDWSMPEEHNRVMLDHISDILFAPTDLCAQNLNKESVMGEIKVVGNTVVDSLKMALEKSLLVRPKSIMSDKFILATSHRQENVDDPVRLKSILVSLNNVSDLGVTVIFPMHPRTKKMISAFGYQDLLSPNIKVITPVRYEEMLWLIKNAQVVITDSGGLQEESCVLGTPCVTIRDNTERPESVDVGANIIVGVNPSSVLKAVKDSLTLSREGKSWTNPFGEGNSADQIAEILCEKADLFGDALR